MSKVSTVGQTVIPSAPDYKEVSPSTTVSLTGQGLKDLSMVFIGWTSRRQSATRRLQQAIGSGITRNDWRQYHAVAQEIKVLDEELFGKDGNDGIAAKGVAFCLGKLPNGESARGVNMVMSDTETGRDYSANGVQTFDALTGNQEANKLSKLIRAAVKAQTK